MTSRATLLRRPEDPRRVTFLDLFFDLVFVFALFRLSHGLQAHLNGSGAFQTLVLLLAAMWVWTMTAAITDRFDPGRWPIQMLVVGSMFGSFILAAAATEAFGTRGLLFAGAYIAVQVGRGLFLVAVTRGDQRQRPELRLLFWFGVSAMPWLAGALVQGWARGVLWALAVAADYTAAGLNWPTPGLGRTRAPGFGLSGEFVAERQRQFFIIALGELILVSGLALTSDGFQADRTAAVAVAFATTVLMWRITIYRAAGVLGAAVTAAPDPVRVAVAGAYAHVVMIAGIVATSVGDELVIRHPFGHTQPAWIALILGGPALFLTGRAILGYAVFGRVSRDRVIGVLVLAAISPGMILVPPVLVALTGTVVLAGIAVADRAWRRAAEPPSPPRRPA
jgi:low temperature requirement protein LtrA